MNKEEIKFRIDQLRKDRMIYAMESAAISIAVVAISIFLPVLTVQVIKLDDNGFIRLNIFFAIITIGYLVYAIFGNIYRLVQIRKLEQKLYKK